jgi:hypothetical protein
MTTAPAPAASRLRPARHRPGLGAARLLRLELRRNVMLWMLPVAAALFWFTTYRKTMAMPPLWNLRAANLQSGALLAFILPVVGAAAWMGSRDARRHTTDLVAITARPAWIRQLATWAATTCWALAGYLGCLAVLYGVTGHQASWGGPLWGPAAVAAASLPALSALGFAAGTLGPSRLTAPLAAIAAFFALALSTQLIHGSQSYWQISPVVTGPWDDGADPGVGTFYPHLPDLSIAQVMFLVGLTIALLAALALPRDSGGRRLRAAAAAVTAAGLLTAGTAVKLAGTGTMDAHGMIAIPALHDAANDRPLRFSPVCSQTAIPVCLNPAYAGYLPAVTAALKPVLGQIAGLPGGPARISQSAAAYQQGAGNAVSVGLPGPAISGRPPVYHLLLPNQLLAPPMTTSQLASAVRAITGPGIIAGVIADGPGASQAQHAVATALMMAAGLLLRVSPPGPSAPGPGSVPVQRARCVHRASCAPGQATQPGGVAGPPVPELAPGSPAAAAARRFAALPALARHIWLARHLTALRAGQITLAQLP